MSNKLIIGYTPDQLNCKMAHIDSGLLVDGLVYTQDAVRQLKAERDALLAMAESVKYLFALDCVVGCDGHLIYPIKQYNAVVDALNSKPQQHLAEIRAEAVADFAKALSNTVQIPNGAMTRVDYYKAAIRHAIQFASQYAEQIRQGGAQC
jgi:hypothetical protein